MTIPFLQGATGDPINLRRQMAPQSERGVPAVTGFSEFYSNGGPIVITPETYPPAVISNSGAPLQELVGKLRVGNGPLAIGDVDPANKAALMLFDNIARRHDLTDLLLGRKRWAFHLGGATASAGFLTLLNDSDVLPRQRFIDMIVRQLEIQASAGDNLAMTAQLAVGPMDMWGEVTQVAGTGSSVPTVSGYYPPAMDQLDATDKDVYIMWVDFSLRTFKAKVGIGAGVSLGYGSQVYTFTYDEATRVFDDTNVPIGSFGEQMKIRVPTGATGANGDVFKFPKRRAAFGASALGARRPISSTFTTVFLNGNERRIEGGWSATLDAPDVDAREDTGGRQSRLTTRRGRVNLRIRISREIVDLDNQAALMNATTIPVVLHCESATIISGGSLKPFRFMLIAPACKPNGDTFDVSVGGSGRDEDIELVAGVPDSAYNYTPPGDAAAISVSDHFAAVFENDVATL